jgi:hypothetical protein
MGALRKGPTSNKRSKRSQSPKRFKRTIARRRSQRHPPGLSLALSRAKTRNNKRLNKRRSLRMRDLLRRRVVIARRRKRNCKNRKLVRRQ